MKAPKSENKMPSKIARIFQKLSSGNPPSKKMLAQQVPSLEEKEEGGWEAVVRSPLIEQRIQK